jgi:membrane protein DedA with SNARE-associated domain
VSLTSDAAVQGSLGALGALVLLGSVLPVVPTGALVAAAVAYATSDGWFAVLMAFVVAAVAALVGDVVTLALLRSGGGALARRWREKHSGEGLDRVSAQLEERGVALLLLARLVPAGRLPALLAAGIARLPWPRVLPAQAAGCALWSLAYGVVGIAGGGLFDSPPADAGFAVLLVLAVTGGQALLSRRRTARARTAV